MVWPTDKPSIEAKVFDYFRAHIPADERRYHGITNVRQNDAENDLDGTVETTRGDILIDVAEVAPLEKLRGRYDDANAAATIGELADALTSVVFKKSQKYAGITPRPWLLLYTTHWAFNPTQTAQLVAGAELCRIKHHIGRVFLLSPMDEDTAEVATIYPAPIEVLRLDISAMRPLPVMNFDPTKWEIGPA
jgi:hypothetical protein